MPTVSGDGVPCVLTSGGVIRHMVTLTLLCGLTLNLKARDPGQFGLFDHKQSRALV